MSKRKFFALARELDDFVDKKLPKDARYDVFASPEGPPQWDETDVEIQLSGIRAYRESRRD
jgi:hypothetical protein